MGLRQHSENTSNFQCHYRPVIKLNYLIRAILNFIVSSSLLSLFTFSASPRILNRVIHTPQHLVLTIFNSIGFIFCFHLLHLLPMFIIRLLQLLLLYFQCFKFPNSFQLLFLFYHSCYHLLCLLL